MLISSLLPLNLDFPEIDSNLSETWIFAHGFVLGLSKHHMIAELIVKSGFLPYHIKELGIQRMMSIDKVSSSFRTASC